MTLLSHIGYCPPLVRLLFTPYHLQASPESYILCHHERWKVGKLESWKVRNHAHGDLVIILSRPGMQRPGGGRSKSCIAKPGPDERFKANILVIVAHPDDETLIAGYLARAIFDQKKKVAIIRNQGRRRWKRHRL